MRERIEMEELFKNEVDAARAYATAQVDEARQSEKEELLAKQDKVWFLSNIADVSTFLHQIVKKKKLFSFFLATVLYSIRLDWSSLARVDI